MDFGVHHPRSPWGLPWYWWLQAGRDKLIPPVAIGVLDAQLKEAANLKEKDGPEVDQDDFPDLKRRS